MTALFLVLAQLAASPLEIRVAPDHPLRQVYLDEPLTLQLKVTEPTTVRGWVEVIDDRGEHSIEALRSVELTPAKPFMQPITAFDGIRGYYTARVLLHANGQTMLVDQSFCRMARPAADLDPPLAVRLPELSQLSVLALAAVPIREVWIDALAPNVAETVQASRQAGLRVVLRIDATTVADPSELQALAVSLGEGYGESVSGWAIDTNGDPEIHNAVARTLTRKTSRPLLAIAESPDALRTLLAGSEPAEAHRFVLSGLGWLIDGVALAWEIAQNGGLERPEFVIEHAGDLDLSLAKDQTKKVLGARLARDMAEGASLTVLPIDVLLRDGELTPGVVYAHAIATRLSGADYVGELPLGDGNHALVFREGAGWRVMFWTNGKPKLMQVSPGSALDMALFDGRNNTATIQTVENGQLRLKMDEEPRFLTGTGGSVLAQAAQTVYTRSTDLLLHTEGFAEKLPEELIGAIKAERETKESTMARVNLFTFLQTFPYLEQQWRDGVIESDVAVPAMAALSRMLESAFVLEQERGQPFLEAPQAALARCAQFRTEFLTGQGNGPGNRNRARWMLSEIGRLTEKAETLIQADRLTEATGIAGLAEWRARSLAFTSRTAVEVRDGS